MVDYTSLIEGGDGTCLASTLWEDSDKIPEGRTSTYILWFTGVRGEGCKGKGPAAAPDAGVQR